MEPHTRLYLLCLLLETQLHPSIYSEPSDVGFAEHQSSVTERRSTIPALKQNKFIGCT